MYNVTCNVNITNKQTLQATWLRLEGRRGSCGGDRGAAPASAAAATASHSHIATPRILAKPRRTSFGHHTSAKLRSARVRRRRSLPPAWPVRPRPFDLGLRMAVAGVHEHTAAVWSQPAAAATHAARLSTALAASVPVLDTAVCGHNGRRRSAPPPRSDVRGTAHSPQPTEAIGTHPHPVTSHSHAHFRFPRSPCLLSLGTLARVRACQGFSTGPNWR